MELTADELAAGPESSGSAAWRRAIEAVVPCVVVLKVTLTRAVDTEPASSAYATGFIVDKHRGILLTNRHVHTPGPISADAIFLNREELPVSPLYSDPVHDFAFLRFDPAKLQFMEVSEVPLAPEAASVGLDIRVVGNDSGEKVSILSGVIARLDRDAPSYGRAGYNDFNTFYLQAASGTKGGSSGSPVIDIHGRAVGLNAGGKTKAASAYYLPLERVVRALRIIQASKDLGSPADAWPAFHVPRGDLQATFGFKGFDEVRRLGLQQETERAVRAAPARSHGNTGDAPLSTTGMLVVESVVPCSPAAGLLHEGDVLVRVNGQVVTHFLSLEEVLDACVDQPVSLGLERGNQQVEVQVKVTDLHTVTPSSFLELAGGTCHALSYQQARNNRAAVGQVYVAEPGYMLGRSQLPKFAIILSLDGKPTPDLLSFATVLRGLPHGARTPLEYFVFQERHRKRSVILHMDRQWYGPPVFWQRDPAGGCWRPTTDYPPGVPDPPAAPLFVATSGASVGGLAGAPPSQPALDTGPPDDAAAAADDDTSPGALRVGATAQPAAACAPTAALANGDAHMNGAASPAPSSMQAGAVGKDETVDTQQLEDALRCSLVLLDVEIPLVALIDGVHSRSFTGNGVIVHHSERLGLVLTDRNTVVVGSCDINISFGGHPAEVTGIVRFMHPLHNFALISYDPAHLPEEARRKVRAAQLLPDPPIRRGDTVILAGITKFLRIMQRKSIVTTATSAITIPTAHVPRFRAVHEEVIKLDQDFGSTFSGVLTDAAGRVRALWGSYAEQVEKEEREWCAGLPTAVFQPWVDQLKGLESHAGAPPSVRTLDAELEALMLSKAAQFGLPAEWVSRLDALDPERRQVLRVRSMVANSDASRQLCSGDMLLAVAGQPVTSFQDVETIIATYNAPSSSAHTHSPTPLSGPQAAPDPPVQGDEDGGHRTPAVGPSSASVPHGKRREPPAGDTDSHAAAAPSTCTAADAASPSSPGRAAKRRAGAGRPLTSPPAVADPAHQAAANATAALLEPSPCTPGAAAPAVPASAAARGQGHGTPVIPLTIFRKGAIHELQVTLGLEAGMGTDRVISWCGAQVQAPHRAVREMGYLPEVAGVYISRWHHGSPAHRYGLFALHCISEANGRPTPDLDTFVEIIRSLKHGQFVRVKMVHLESNSPKVLTLKLDLAYWPTTELRLQQHSCAWERVSISATP